MRRVLDSLSRGVCVAAVVVTLVVPAAYAAPRDRDGGGLMARVVRVIKHVISVVSGDGLIEPKPSDPPPAP